MSPNERRLSAAKHHYVAGHAADYTIEGSTWIRDKPRAVRWHEGQAIIQAEDKRDLFAARPDKGKIAGGGGGILVPQVVLYKEEIDTREGIPTLGLGEHGLIKLFLGDGIGGRDVANPSWDQDTRIDELRPLTDIPLANEVIAGARFEFTVGRICSPYVSLFLIESYFVQTRCATCRKFGYRCVSEGPNSICMGCRGAKWYGCWKKGKY